MPMRVCQAAQECAGGGGGSGGWQRPREEEQTIRRGQLLLLFGRVLLPGQYCVIASAPFLPS